VKSAAKSLLLLLITLCVVLMGIWLYELDRQVQSLTDLVTDLSNSNVPNLTITGKYPYVEVNKGAIVVMDNKDKSKGN